MSHSLPPAAEIARVKTAVDELLWESEYTWSYERPVGPENYPNIDWAEIERQMNKNE